MKSHKFISEAAGNQLREIRKQRGVKSASLLSKLMDGAYSPSGILRREEGKLQLDFTYIDRFCNALKITGEQREIVSSSIKVSLWGSDSTRNDAVDEFYKAQSVSRKIFSYVAMLIPGFLQTYEYAQSILQRYYPSKDVSQRAQQRIQENEKILLDFEKEVKIVLSVSGLYQSVGCPLIMIDQLRSLKIKSVIRNDFLRILPSDRFLPVPDKESFLIFDERIGFFETRVGMMSTNKEFSGEELSSDFQVLWENSVSGEEANKLIDKAIAHYQAML